MFRHDSKKSFACPSGTPTYASGDLVANSATAGSVVPLEIPIGDNSGNGGIILAARIWKSGTSTTNASFRVHIFATQPTVANGDDGVFSPNNAENYLGYFDVSVNVALSDGASGRSYSGDYIAVGALSGKRVASVFVLVEARAGYTRASGETIGVALDTSL